MRDWSAAFRVPYWNHNTLVDWSGPMHAFAVPIDRVLIAPTQWLFHNELKQCCNGNDCDEVGKAQFCMVSRSRGNSADGCCRQRQKTAFACCSAASALAPPAAPSAHSSASTTAALSA